LSTSNKDYDDNDDDDDDDDDDDLSETRPLLYKVLTSKRLDGN